MKKQEEPLLIAQEGPLKGERWSIAQTIVLGREAGCDVVIPDRQISRYHARLTPTSSGVMLEDLGSKNGTYHNGVLLSAPVMLQDGDELAVGVAQQFSFLTSDATMPLVEAVKPGRLMIDQKSRQVWVRQQQLVPPLSAQQFKLLWLLYESQGNVINRVDLVASVWGEEGMGGVSEQALDALLRRLRDRLAALDPTHQYITTLRGHGVRLDNPPT